LGKQRHRRMFQGLLGIGLSLGHGRPLGQLVFNFRL
jgi:hypothetical protein